MRNALEQYDAHETELCKRNYYNACVAIMDGDICDEVYETLAGKNNAGGVRHRDFLVAYSTAHEEKYGEDFMCA